MRVDEFVAAVQRFPWLRLYHAAQLRDLRTYVDERRIVPRGTLFARGVNDYTPFDSDHHDIEHHCEHDVFGNLVDQNVASKNGRWIPNIYGPITLVFPVSAVENGLNDNVIVRKGGIFSGDEEGARPLSPAELTEMLRTRGGSREFQLVHGSLRLSDLQYVLVAPLVIDGQELIRSAEELLAPIGLGRGRPIPVLPRNDLSHSWRDDYGRLVEWAAEAPIHEGCDVELPLELQEWYQSLNGTTKQRNLRRFAEYLSHGTISSLRGLPGHLAAQYEGGGEADIVEENLEPDPRTELPQDEIYHREYTVWKADQSYTEYAAAVDSGDVESAAAQWYILQDAISELNIWIREIRGSILSDEEEYRIWYPDGHDRAMSHELTEWASRFTEIEDLDDFDASDPEILEPYWRDVKNYPTSIYDL